MKYYLSGGIKYCIQVSEKSYLDLATFDYLYTVYE